MQRYKAAVTALSTEGDRVHSAGATDIIQLDLLIMQFVNFLLFFIQNILNRYALSLSG